MRSAEEEEVEEELPELWEPASERATAERRDFLLKGLVRYFMVGIVGLMLVAVAMGGTEGERDGMEDGGTKVWRGSHCLLMGVEEGEGEVSFDEASFWFL